MNHIKNIGILGHYGNQNLGDEAIIEAMIENIKKRKPDVILSCLSINPQDSMERYNVESFPIRYREDFFMGSSGRNNTENKNDDMSDIDNDTSSSVGLKVRIKKLPLIGAFIKMMLAFLHFIPQLKTEVVFLLKAKAHMKSIDLLIICGSNQFLDNFGGAWGFPYTLLKWTILAKLSGSKVAFVSIGAGPLTHPLSYSMLKIALGKADYLSYRDIGSKQLVESRLKKIDGRVYPDIAHSLPYEVQKKASSCCDEDKDIVGINPMPVYDQRYWFERDDEKYDSYVCKIADLCLRLVKKGCRVKLFGTQKNDEDVINDIMNLLGNDKFDMSVKELNEIETVMDQTVSELMNTIDSCDVIFATRFHATVLPLKLNKPVVGICYYRKSSELLNEVGLGDFHVQIDDFTSDELYDNFNRLMLVKDAIRESIASIYSDYEDELEEQYEYLLKMG